VPVGCDLERYTDTPPSSFPLLRKRLSTFPPMRKTDAFLVLPDLAILTVPIALCSRPFLLLFLGHDRRGDAHPPLQNTPKALSNAFVFDFRMSFAI